MMPPTLSIPVPIVILIFAAGFGVGWVLKSARSGDAANFEDMRDRLATPPVGTKTIRTLKLKCKCGETLEFRDPPDPGRPDVLPFPEGDSIECPHCGNVVDLKKVRELSGGGLPR